MVTRSRPDEWGPDFWLFDPGAPDARAVIMDYSADGRWLGAELLTDPDTVRSLAEVRDSAMSQAMPLNEEVTNPDDVTLYGRLWDRLWDAADHGADAVARIKAAR